MAISSSEQIRGSIMWFFLAFRCLAVSMALSFSGQSVHAADCGCSNACSSAYGKSACLGGSLSSCLASCERSEKLERDTAELRTDLNGRASTLIPAFQAARNRLWDTGPQAPNFRQVLSAYKNARNQRDKALLAEYGALGLSALLDGSGSKISALDAKYLVPQKAQQAFHDFALAKLKSTLNAGSRNGGGYDRMEEAMGGQGSYYGYVELADQAELDIFPLRHGGAPGAHIAAFDQVLDYDVNRVPKCLNRTRKVVPQQWANGQTPPMNPAFEKFFTACLRASD